MSGRKKAQGQFTAQPLAALPPYGCGVPLAGAALGSGGGPSKAVEGFFSDQATAKQERSRFNPLGERKGASGGNWFHPEGAAAAGKDIPQNVPAPWNPPVWLRQPPPFHKGGWSARQPAVLTPPWQARQGN